MIDGRHCNLCYLDIVAGGSQCSDPGGSLLPDSDNDGLWMSTQLVTVVTMTNLHCSSYMILCQTLALVVIYPAFSAAAFIGPRCVCRQCFHLM